MCHSVLLMDPIFILRLSAYLHATNVPDGLWLWLIHCLHLLIHWLIKSHFMIIPCLVAVYPFWAHAHTGLKARWWSLIVTLCQSHFYGAGVLLSMLTYKMSTSACTQNPSEAQIKTDLWALMWTAGFSDIALMCSAGFDDKDTGLLI